LATYNQTFFDELRKFFFLKHVKTHEIERKGEIKRNGKREKMKNALIVKEVKRERKKNRDRYKEKFCVYFQKRR